MLPTVQIDVNHKTIFQKFSLVSFTAPLTWWVILPQLHFTSGLIVSLWGHSHEKCSLANLTRHGVFLAIAFGVTARLAACTLSNNVTLTQLLKLYNTVQRACNFVNVFVVCSLL